MFTSIKQEDISGNYKHFKGHNYYVFCVAVDTKGDKFVFYQQEYGTRDFWIRPYNMFFEKIKIENKFQTRFEKVKTKDKKIENKTKDLIDLISKQEIIVTHTETENKYFIINIDTRKNFILVSKTDETETSGYLTDYSLISRMGYRACVIDGDIKIFDNNNIKNEFKFIVGTNDEKLIKRSINPCSIDIQIADRGFIKTKRKFIDPQSVEHVSKASDLWKSVKTYVSKNKRIKYFKIKPGETILTHTKEKIKIPSDCAGKIEIKSTFARLSLSVTYGDFCNPSYEGFFPIEITNHGKHTIAIHENETMMQLMLLPLSGPILIGYIDKATFSKDKGFDDGTPYAFWRERSIKQLRKKDGSEKLIETYETLLDKITKQERSEVNESKQRFNDNFLPFCQKSLRKDKYIDKDTGSPDVKKIVYKYVNREKKLRKFSFSKWISLALAVISLLVNILNKDPNASKLKLILWCAIGVFVCTSVLLWWLLPKNLCTLEGIDVAKVVDETNSKN